MWTIRIVGSNVVAPCPWRGKPLHAGEAAVPFPQVKPINVGCRQGDCGPCRVRVLSGSYDTIETSRAHVIEGERAEGTGQACRIIPASDLLTETAFISPMERAERRRANQRETA